MAVSPLRIFVFFTWDVSLATWQQKGLLQREILYYQKLLERGFEITFLTWGDDADFEIAGQMDPRFSVIPVYADFPRFKNIVLRAILSPATLWRFRRALKSADIYKTNQMWGGWIPALGRLLYRKPLLVRTGYELYRFSMFEGHGKARQLFVKAISRLTYGIASKIYLTTAEDKDFVVKEFGIFPSKIDVRPNWIDIEKFKPQAVDVEPETLLFVGRLTAQKNLPLVVDAIAGTSWRLTVIGQGELKTDLERLAKDKNANVRFIDSVPNDQLSDYYNRHEIFVLPSLYEGNPKTLLEAMACGRPVVALDAEGIRGLVIHGENGVLCQNNAASLRFAIKSMLDSPEKRRALGCAARVKIERDNKLEMLVAKEEQDFYSFVRMGKEHERKI